MFHQSMFKKTLLSITIFFSVSISCLAQQKMLYKQMDTIQLFLEIYKPEKMETSNKYPAMVFFFGGGWKGGSTKQFHEHAKYFSHRGIVCFLVEYRTEEKFQTTPFESVADAKSAIRFIRENATNFGVDKDKIIASGGSAGGHLAAATALIQDFNDPADNLTISSIPNVLVLFNPVIDNGAGGYGFERIGEAYKGFSPLHNIRKGAPPTLFFLGSKDPLIPIETAEYYKLVMEKVGSRCDLHIYEDQVHGFFNFKNLEYYKKTVYETDLFLQSLGYLTEDNLIESEKY